ncbi:hypothetical protein DV707_07980 [Halobellus limi]|uniref:Uncharacterized protein n=1 Tax=Halobellus limi TaxID=699433 RepID=A0A4D6H1X7_9EURY|nr:hypothetical protein DV707_07980 [Halobellus limi]
MDRYCERGTSLVSRRRNGALPLERVTERPRTRFHERGRISSHDVDREPVTVDTTASGTWTSAGGHFPKRPGVPIVLLTFLTLTNT